MNFGNNQSCTHSIQTSVTIDTTLRMLELRFFIAGASPIHGVVDCLPLLLLFSTLACLSTASSFRFVPSMPRSQRLKEREARTVRSEHQRIRELDRASRREPSQCTEPNCSRPARHQGSLCEAHHNDTVPDKEGLPLMYQRCPHLLPSYNRCRIRWAPFWWAIGSSRTWTLPLLTRSCITDCPNLVSGRLEGCLRAQSF